jgi:hypothetical protein
LGSPYIHLPYMHIAIIGCHICTSKWECKTPLRQYIKQIILFSCVVTCNLSLASRTIIKHLYANYMHHITNLLQYIQYLQLLQAFSPGCTINVDPINRVPQCLVEPQHNISVVYMVRSKQVRSILKQHERQVYLMCVVVCWFSTASSKRSGVHRAEAAPVCLLIHLECSLRMASGMLSKHPGS